MTPSAWVFMLSVWTIVIIAVVYCFWKLLRVPLQLDEEQPGADIERSVPEDPTNRPDPT